MDNTTESIEQKERALFEAHMRKEGWGGWSICVTNGLYHDGAVERMWRVWKARAALSSTTDSASPSAPRQGERIAATKDVAVTNYGDRAPPAQSGKDAEQRPSFTSGYVRGYKDAMKTVSPVAAPQEAPQQEPVAWKVQDEQDFKRPGTGTCFTTSFRPIEGMHLHVTPLYAAPVSTTSAKEPE